MSDLKSQPYTWKDGEWVQGWPCEVLPTKQPPPAFTTSDFLAHAGFKLTPWQEQVAERIEGLKPGSLTLDFKLDRKVFDEIALAFDAFLRAFGARRPQDSAGPYPLPIDGNAYRRRVRNRRKR